MNDNVNPQREKVKQTFVKLFSISEDRASNEEIRDRLLAGGKVTGTNMCVMVCAILIASVGLRTNSVAVIIGAMLISPLMGSILAISYGTVSNDPYLVRRHAIGFAMQREFRNEQIKLRKNMASATINPCVILFKSEKSGKT